MQESSIDRLGEFYHSQLLDDILPFWLRHARDQKAGGYHTCLARDGTVYDFDKRCMWHAGRLIWIYSHLYNEWEPRSEWLDFARHGIEFVEKHGFAPDGSLYYALTREGTPLVPACDFATEMSTILGYTEYARATRETYYYDRAVTIMKRMWDAIARGGPESFPPVLWETRPVRWFAHSMIVLNVLQQLCLFRDEQRWRMMREECARIMLEHHYKKEQRAAFEYVAWDGSLLPGTLGRRVNPGHMIEGGIFLIHEGREIQNEELVQAGVDMIRDGYELGWDREFGGIFNSVDIENLPIPDLEAFLSDGKLWWQHAEALYGLLLAWKVTGDSFFRENYWKVHRYSFDHFADPEYGEWYAHLDRRGNRISTAKGTDRKNLFHIGRNFFWCYRLFEE